MTGQPPAVSDNLLRVRTISDLNRRTPWIVQSSSSATRSRTGTIRRPAARREVPEEIRRRQRDRIPFRRRGQRGARPDRGQEPGADGQARSRAAGQRRDRRQHPHGLRPLPHLHGHGLLRPGPGLRAGLAGSQLLRGHDLHRHHQRPEQALLDGLPPEPEIQAVQQALLGAAELRGLPQAQLQRQRPGQRRADGESAEESAQGQALRGHPRLARPGRDPRGLHQGGQRHPRQLAHGPASGRGRGPHDPDRIRVAGLQGPARDGQDPLAQADAQGRYRLHRSLYRPRAGREPPRGHRPAPGPRAERQGQALPAHRGRRRRPAGPVCRHHPRPSARHPRGQGRPVRQRGRPPERLGHHLPKALARSWRARSSS